VVEERFFLVFPSSFVILGVGQSLSGYELSVSIGMYYLWAAAFFQRLVARAKSNQIAEGFEFCSLIGSYH